MGFGGGAGGKSKRRKIGPMCKMSTRKGPYINRIKMGGEWIDDEGGVFPGGIDPERGPSVNKGGPRA